MAEVSTPSRFTFVDTFRHGILARFLFLLCLRLAAFSSSALLHSLLSGLCCSSPSLSWYTQTKSPLLYLGWLFGPVCFPFTMGSSLLSVQHPLGPEPMVTNLQCPNDPSRFVHKQLDSGIIGVHTTSGRGRFGIQQAIGDNGGFFFLNHTKDLCVFILRRNSLHTTVCRKSTQ